MQERNSRSGQEHWTERIVFDIFVSHIYSTVAVVGRESDSRMHKEIGGARSREPQTSS